MSRALVLVLLATAAAVARPRPTPCELGRFLTADGHHVLTDLVAPGTESIVIGDGTVAIAPGCAPIAATPRTTRRGTVVRAAWTSCDGAPGRVKLRATIPARACDRLRGVVTLAKGRPKHRKLRAERAPFQYDVALDPTSPWPKFRRTSRQDGRS